MRIAIVQFPGSEGERDTSVAVKRAAMEPVAFLWNQSTAALAECAGYIIVGGFSDEDRLHSGVIAALDPLMTVISEQSELGKPVLGIGSGAQILVATGLVPGIARHQVGMALTANKRMSEGRLLGTGFYDAGVHMRLTDHFQYNAFTRFLTPKTILPVSVAHSEGRFVIPPGLLAEMQVQGLGLFQYCDADGRIIDAFPVNPNGSVQNIAAVSNKAGNVMAMVPHPERTPHGDAIFNSMREHIAKGHAGQVTPLHYQPRTLPVTQYRAAPGAIEWLVHADNEALSVENALQQYDLPVRVQRQAHWEILCDSPEVLAQIRASDVLFNAHADPLMTPAPVTTANEMAYLVRAHDDLIGLEKKQRLEHECGIRGIHSLRHSIVWRFSATQDLPALCERVMQSPILYNPHAADCYHYEAQVIRKG